MHITVTRISCRYGVEGDEAKLYIIMEFYTIMVRRERDTRKSNNESLFGCSRIHINPHVLRWIGVELELNSTPIHTNTHGLKKIRQHPKKA